VVSALAKPAGLIIQQARQDVGIDPKVAIIGNSGFNSPAMIAAAGPAVEGTIVGAAWNLNAAGASGQKFIEAYRAKTRKAPDQFAAESYAGVDILWDAARRAAIGGKPLAEARIEIRDSLKVTSLATVLGDFSFTAARDGSHTPVVQIVKDGKFDIFK
jgi:branched-chain amino acid transport system substrate-binding protein